MSRAEINLTALRHNLNIVRSKTNARVMAVIKANAYGHGMIKIARTLDDADGFAVATIEEAIDLREAGIHQNVLVLEGFHNIEGLRLLKAYNLQSVIHTERQVRELETSGIALSRAWLKIDTGMHRLGFAPGQAASIYQRLKACDNISKPINVMTHLACADDERSAYTETQLSDFRQCIELMSLADDAELSVANSAGILAWPDSHTASHWVRPGIMLYGGSPVLGKTAAEFDLKPVMTLKSEVIAVHRFKQGDSIGYAQSYICESDCTVAVVAIGYGDGYPRHAQSGTPVLINARQYPLVGRVSMDMISVDVSDADDVNIGDQVTLWGEGLPADIIATHANTISYELFCALTQRVRFQYYAA